MFGLVTDILPQWYQPTFFSIARNISFSAGLDGIEPASLHVEANTEPPIRPYWPPYTINSWILCKNSGSKYFHYNSYIESNSSLYRWWSAIIRWVMKAQDLGAFEERWFTCNCNREEQITINKKSQLVTKKLKSRLVIKVPAGVTKHSSRKSVASRWTFWNIFYITFLFTVREIYFCFLPNRKEYDSTYW